MARRVRIIGLTGGIGMGKTLLASQLATFGARICNADAIVHGLMQKGGAAVAAIAAQFPQAVSGGEVNRKALGDIVFKDAAKLDALESILHPLVIEAENRFIRAQERLGAKFIVLDIPLLFETGGQVRCDATFLASAPAFIQKQRVMKRTGMTEAKFRQIRNRQMSDRDKRRRADHIIPTGLGRAFSYRVLAKIMRHYEA